MTDALTHVVVVLNAGANALGRSVLAPVGVLPGWLSVTLVAAATGLLLLVVFKYTSNQRAIKAVRNDIKAHLLALKLFKDSPRIVLRAQGRILLGAGRLLLRAVVPMLVMAVPVCLLLGQLALWYQARPLRVGEDAVVIVKLGGGAGSAWPRVSLQPEGAVETTGRMRVLSERWLCWRIRAREAGYHRLVFQVDGQAVEKEVAVGDGFMRVGTERPGWSWSDALLHPAEEPLGPDSPVRAIEVNYDTKRASWTSGSNSWVIYWFVASMVAALCFRRFLHVNV